MKPHLPFPLALVPPTEIVHKKLAVGANTSDVFVLKFKSGHLLLNGVIKAIIGVERNAFAVTCDSTTDKIAKTAHGLLNGQPVYIAATTTEPAGVTNGTIYYVGSTAANDFKICDTLAHAHAGTNFVDITTNGVAVYCKPIQLADLYQVVGAWSTRRNSATPNGDSLFVSTDNLGALQVVGFTNSTGVAICSAIPATDVDTNEAQITVHSSVALPTNFELTATLFKTSYGISDLAFST